MIERDRRQQIKSGRILTDFHVNAIAGAISGVFVSILVSPLDVVRIRIQVKRLPKGVPDTSLYVVMYRLCKQEGIRAFYKGLGATMLGYVPNWAAYFTAYQWSRKQYASQFKNQNREMLINLLASLTAGAFSNTLIAPLWTIRTRLMTQCHHETYRNSFDAARKIYQTEGLYAFYRGLVPSMIGLIHVGIQFPLYEHLKQRLQDPSSPDRRLSTTKLIIASAVSKFVASGIAYPHEIIRSRLQDAGHARSLQQQNLNETIEFRQYRNVRDAFQTIAREEGLRGFYRGLQPTLLRTVPAAVLTLLSYEKVKDYLVDKFDVECVSK